MADPIRTCWVYDDNLVQSGVHCSGCGVSYTACSRKIFEYSGKACCAECRRTDTHQVKTELTQENTMAKIVTLQPLDLGEHADVDSPELAAYKERVRAEAKKHSLSHHCGDIRDIVKRLGLDEKTVKVDVSTTHPFRFTVSIKPSKYAGKSAAEQAALIAEQIGVVKFVTPAGVQLDAGLNAVTITAESIVSMGIHVPVMPAGAPSVALDAADAWLFVSAEGRVRHLFRGAQDRIDIRNDRNAGDNARYHARWTTAVCGLQEYVDNVKTESARDGGGYCLKCTRKAQATT